MAGEQGTSEQAVSEIEAALRSMESLAAKPAPAGRPTRPRRASGPTPERGRVSFVGTAFRWICGVLAVASLPFLVLVRLSVFLYSEYGIWPWVSVTASAVGAAAVLVVATLIFIRIGTGNFRAPRYLKRFALGLAVAYCGYSALFVSATNVKTEEVRRTYTSLHPSLRIALSTWMLVDSELVITDGERQIEDYALMGLRRNESSLHLVTSSGHVHAVDLRTLRRPEWRNFITTVYFKIMGFRTRRHVGTADHLHVSLPVSD